MRPIFRGLVIAAAVSRSFAEVEALHDEAARELGSVIVPGPCAPNGVAKTPGIYCVSSSTELSWNAARLAAGSTISKCTDSYFICGGNGRMVKGPVLETPGNTKCLPAGSSTDTGNWSEDDQEDATWPTDHFISSLSPLCAIPSPSATPSATATSSSSGTASQTSSVSASGSQTGTPSSTASSSETSTPSNTGTPSSSETATGTQTPSSSATASSSETSTPSNTGTPSSSETATGTQTPSSSATASSSETSTSSETPSSSSTPSSSETASSTGTASETPSISSSPAPSSSNTPASTPSATASKSAAGCTNAGALGATGVSLNVGTCQLQAAGWSQCYDSWYGQGGLDLIANIKAACSGSNMLMACYSKANPGVMRLAAWAPTADVIYPVAGTSTAHHDANGVSWYFTETYSWGFYHLGDTVSRGSCDTASGSFPGQRMCNHASAGKLNFGYRCGTTFLNNGIGTDGARWHRVWYTKN